MSSPDQLDTIIQDIMDGHPRRAGGPRQPHHVLWFAVGMILWQVNGILLYLFLWLLLHG